jgi:hypothetical protein
MKEAELREKLETKFEINHLENKATLQIKYWEDGKTKSVEKRYKKCGKDAAMEYMKARQKELIDEFASMFG